MVAAAVVFAESEDDPPGPRPGPGEPGRLLPFRDPASAGREQPAVDVLLVEDDPSMRMLCKVNLESTGFRVVVASSGKEGLALAASEQPDLVLLDVMLPDLGGFEVAAQLKVPVVFLSARTSQLDLERGRQLGAIDYVTKPFDPTTLPLRLREDLDELDRTGSAERVWRMRFGPPGRRGA